MSEPSDGSETTRRATSRRPRRTCPTPGPTPAEVGHHPRRGGGRGTYRGAHRLPLRHLLTRNQSQEEAERRREQGVLFGSGLVGGGGLTGVLLAVWVFARGGVKITGYAPALPGWATELLALVTIGLILFVMSRIACRKSSTA